MNSSLILIGMPGSGKTTVGELLAKRLDKPLIDTDLLIRKMIDCSLQEYRDHHGFLALRHLEEQMLTSSNFSDSIVSTGGSVIYSEKGMLALKQAGTCIYLEISFETLERRVNNYASRGIACSPGTSARDMFEERLPLYKKYADITINCDNHGPDETLNNILNLSTNN